MMKKRMFGCPMYDVDATATAAPVVPVPAEVAIATPTVAIVGPTAAQLATMTKEDLAKLKGDIETAASLALATVEEAATKLESEVKDDVDKLIVLEQTFCQQHQIAVGAINTWAAVIGGIVLLKLLGVI